jgi:hypothetical protein
VKKIGRILLGAALALGIMVGNSSVEAHSMTISEATLVVGSGQEGAGEIKPGDKLGKVIALLGDNYELQDFGGEGIRMTKYICQWLKFLRMGQSERDLPGGGSQARWLYA